METLEIKIGFENFANYKRLAYKWWYALAEFVDNSSQSYLDNRDALDAILDRQQESFKVDIMKTKDLIRISDNAMGMDLEELRRAMIVGVPPRKSEGRCRYGLGMKTAACWIGNEWRIISTKLGSEVEYTVEIRVDEIVKGNVTPPIKARDVDKDQHYTILEIAQHNRSMHGNTIRKTKDYLCSIYRKDLSSAIMSLTYNGEALQWKLFSDEAFLARADGTIYKEPIIFEIDTQPPKIAEGWVGVLNPGSYSKAGFSILHRNRVIKGYPDSWRPERIFGKGPANDFINQRLIGELNLEDFEVSHTKDEMNWLGDEEERVETELLKVCAPYMTTAKTSRKGVALGQGPRTVHEDSSLKKLKGEIEIILEDSSLEDEVSPVEQLEENNRIVLQNAIRSSRKFTVAPASGLVVKVYIDDAGSPNDPYVISERKSDMELLVGVNALHPQWRVLNGTNEILIHLRHCVYDCVAEFRAARISRPDPTTVKKIKDDCFRLAFKLALQE